MATQQLYESLRELRLVGFELGLTKILETPDMVSLPFEDKLAFLLESESHERAQRKQRRLEKAAKIKQRQACIEDIDYVAKRGIDRSYLQTLCKCDWVIKNQFLIITGPTGVGKSWLGCALANQVIRLGYSVVYKRFSLLMEELEVARKDGSLPKLRAQLSKMKLLVLDDWAMAPLSAAGRQDLLELVEALSDSGALLITTQLPVSKWHEFIGEPTIADAIMDRIIHRSHRLELAGESMRKLDKVSGD